MAKIHILDSETIDKIAAGEVVERPASVVKELVENAIDAGADAVTVEIKEGGIEFIRVTDNGSGIAKEQLRTAFLRHATSKIETAEDLTKIASLGFRGEALSSIAAVSKVEVITKRRENLVGNRILLEGAAEKSFEEVGAPEGTTFLVRNLFYNTPVRRRFLKQPATEGGYIADLMEHMALSRPDISFKLMMGSQTRFHTSGNGDLREVIYRIYGREVAAALIPIEEERNGICVRGYLGKPVLVRSNRNFEIYFINGRFIRSNVVSKAIEEGYREYLMQHKFPLCVLHITMDTSVVDVNVHPTKMDVRFSNAMEVSELIADILRTALRNREMIPDAVLGDDGEEQKKEQQKLEEIRRQPTPEPFEKRRKEEYRVMEAAKYESDRKKFENNPVWSRVLGNSAEGEAAVPKETERRITESGKEEAAQINFFEEKLLSWENRSRYQIIGQVFDTYWLVQFEEKLFIIDQHAAHEKVKYERLIKQYHEKNVVSQTLMPPVIVSLTGQEEGVLREHKETFAALGFEVEAFGGSEYALRSVPVDLYGCSEREMFLEVLDELSENSGKKSFQVVEEKIASMSCKAAVKGNNRLSREEAEKLIDELLTLENPYNCPHGRPTIISMTKYEMEKKFKRIV